MVHIERAAATLTCWPTMVRSRVSTPGIAEPRLGPALLVENAGEGGFALGQLVEAGLQAFGGPDHQLTLARVERDRGGVGDVEAFDRVA